MDVRKAGAGEISGLLSKNVAGTLLPFPGTKSGLSGVSPFVKVRRLLLVIVGVVVG